MGNYFEEVYLKRMNMGGHTQQERVKTRKEKEFDRLFLKKTEYQAHIYNINGEEADIICSLQPNKWNESHLIGNLLVSTSAPQLSNGNIILIEQQIKEERKDDVYLVFFEEKNITKGYKLFKVICLDSNINITNEYGDTENSFPVKFVSATANLVQDTFVHSHAQYGYREPQASRSFITSDFDFLNKGTYFEYQGRGWEISGIDNISIPNVAYVSISERLLEEKEPKSSQEILVGEDVNFFLNGR